MSSNIACNSQSPARLLIEDMGMSSPDSVPTSYVLCIPSVFLSQAVSLSFSCSIHNAFVDQPAYSPCGPPVAWKCLDTTEYRISCPSSHGSMWQFTIPSPPEHAVDRLQHAVQRSGNGGNAMHRL